MFYRFGFYSVFLEKRILSNSYPRNIIIKWPFIMQGLVEENRNSVKNIELDQLLVKANSILNHEFKIFDKVFNFNDKIDWNISENDSFWPTKKWYLIDLDSAKFGDVKYTWELNRHQFLMTIGRVYYYTNDKKFVDEFKRLIFHWIDSNPVEYGINWFSGLEIALRALSWIVTMDFFYNSLLEDKKFINQFLQELWNFGKHIYYNIFYTKRLMKNNHLIGEATGLLFISLYFQKAGESKKWFNKAMQILKEEAKEQFRKDGTSIEESSAYEVFSLNFLLMCIILLERFNIDVPKELYQAVERGTNFIQYLIKPDGKLSKYGDDDNSKVLSISDNTQAEDLLAVASVIFNREDFKDSIKRGIFPENILFLLGKDGVHRWYVMNKKNKKEVKYFPIGKIGIVNTNDRFLLVKLGNISGHSHADIGHFLWFVDKKDVIIDSGTFKYNTDAKIRNYFRSTEAHNTLVVDGIEQAFPIKTFNWNVVYKLADASFTKKEEIVQFQVTCKIGHYNNLFHTRVILYDFLDKLIIIDRVVGSGVHNLKLNFHLIPPTNSLNSYNDFVEFILSTDKKLVLLPIRRENSIIPYININKGLVSPSYGIKTNAPMVSFIYNKVKLPSTLLTVLHIVPKVCNYRSKIEGMNLKSLLEKDKLVEVTKGVINYLKKGDNC